jgi:hypothetical protein
MALTTLHQEIATNFYPERADFTLTRSMGMDFAANLLTSYPIVCRRELGNHFGTMLRPTAKPWFHPRRRWKDRAKEDTEVRQVLQWMEETQRRAMYDRESLFTRATKEGDHDFAAFGQCAISVEMNKLANGLLYRCWHLRDMVWQENEEGKIGFTRAQVEAHGAGAGAHLRRPRGRQGEGHQPEDAVRDGGLLPLRVRSGHVRRERQGSSALVDLLRRHA